jgi:hypothetical protein
MSGRVKASELLLRTGGTRMTFRVAYGEDAKSKTWVPMSMDERYEISRVGAMEGHARYTNFRQFRVETATEMGKN